MLSEEEVYLGTKNLLFNNKFKILAGQPPRGVDHLPVIEIKDPQNFKKGSKESFKPDLLSYKNNTFYIVECKPEYNISDEIKLLKILNDKTRLKIFYEEIKQRKLLEKHDINQSLEEFIVSTKGVLSYSGNIQENYDDLIHIIIEDFSGHGYILYNE